MAILSPQLRCLSVASNGDVSITWQPISDPLGEFSSYDIYSATNIAGPYTLIASVTPITQDNYLHVGTPANTGIVYYYITTRTLSATNSAIIDTLQTIHLNGTNIGGGIASLSWNAPHTPLLGTSSPTYSIFKEYPSGTWTLLSTTTNSTYSDTITVCTSLINYKVQISDNYPCTSVSSIYGDFFTDLDDPNTPALDSVSVDPVTGFVIIGWNASSSSDTKGYNIYKTTVIGSVSGINTTTFTNAASTASSGSESYDITSYDGGCPANESPHSVPQKTIFTSISLDTCLSTNTVTWTKYINMQGGLGGYKVLCSINGGPFSLLSVLPPTDTSYIHSSLLQATTYCYLIRAFNGSRTISSSSNSSCVNVTLPIQPTYTYLKTATVTGPSTVNISAEVDIAADILSYDIYRTTNISSAFNKIGNIPFTASPVINFTDNTANTAGLSYYYKIIPINSCGIPTTPESNIGRTILLSGTSDDALNNILTWNDYSTWLGNVLSYNIWRSDDGGLTFSIIGNVPFGGSNIYTDNVFNTTGTGNYFYYVEAIEGNPNPYGSQISNSNIVEVVENPILYIPNAFNPGGLNPIFQPKGSFISSQDYHFMIFDRWGKKLFETSDPQQGWDGTSNGELLPEGMYVFSLKFQSRPGEIVKKEGGVFLLR